MRYLNRYGIFENIAQARSILRRNKLSDSDPNFKKILDITNRDGYTGLLTKWVFEDGVDLDEVLSIYSDIRDNKINVSDLNKLSYDDAVDLIYPNKKSENYELIFQYKDYNFYLVKNYQGILEIGSPSWCLKTKSNYDSYTKLGKNPQFILIKKDKVINNKIKLMTPEIASGYGISNYNSTDPTCRYGITLMNNKSEVIFDDNNNNRQYIDKDIILKLREWCLDFFSDFATTVKVSNFERYMTNMINDIIDNDNVTSSSFSNMFGEYKDRREPLRYIKDYVNNNPPRYWVDIQKEGYWDKFLEEYSINRNSISTSEICNISGWTDIVLYELDRLVSIDAENAHPLYGILLSECPMDESIIKYSYGYQNTLYGSEMIKQSFKTIEDWYAYIGNTVIKTDILYCGYFYIDNIANFIDMVRRKYNYPPQDFDIFVENSSFCRFNNGVISIDINRLVLEMKNLCQDEADFFTSEVILSIKSNIASEFGKIFRKNFQLKNDIISFTL